MEEKPTRYSVTIDPDISAYANARDAPLNKTYRHLLRRGYEIETSNEPIPEKLKTQPDRYYVEVTDDMIQYAKEVTGGIGQDADSQIRQWIRTGIEHQREEREIRKNVITHVQTQMLESRVTPMLVDDIETAPEQTPRPPTETETKTAEPKQEIKIEGKPSMFGKFNNFGKKFRR